MLLVAGAVVGGAAAGFLLPGLVARVPDGGPAERLGRPRRPDPADLVLVVAVAATVGRSAELPAFLYLAWIGVALAVIDIRHHHLPDALVLPSYPIALALLGVGAIAAADYEPLARALAGAVLLAGFYYLLAFLCPGGIGLGDVKLAGLLGLYLGWIGWSDIALATAAAFVSAAGVAVVLIAVGRADRSSRIPFGPFMLLGALTGIAVGA